MRDITSDFGTLYHPVKAFVVYQKANDPNTTYVETYDMDAQGYPINAHPLSVRESNALAKKLSAGGERRKGFLKPEELLPANVLYTDAGRDGYAIWYTPAQKVSLLFREDLDIPCGKAPVPSLLWKATTHDLHIYALEACEGLNLDTPLYQSPFFNVNGVGHVCMGTVNVQIASDCPLEHFMLTWQQYFFNSYFSHLIEHRSPVKGNIVQLWKSLVNTRKKFPLKQLLPTRLTIKDLIV